MPLETHRAVILRSIINSNNNNHINNNHINNINNININNNNNNWAAMLLTTVSPNGAITPRITYRRALSRIGP